MIPRVSYLDLVPAGLPIQTREASSGVSGNVSDFELDVINRLVVHSRPTRLFEIGTFDGRTTLNLATHAAPGAVVYTLDLPSAALDNTALKLDEGDKMFIDKPASGLRFAGSDVESQIVQLYGDSGTFDFSSFAGSIDFVFVDGAHSYEYVIKDSQTALSLCSSNAVILWHDYVSHGPTPWPGLSRALDELARQDRRFSNLLHIAGTAIVVRLPSGFRAADGAGSKESLFGDSTQPEYLVCSLSVNASRLTVGPAEQLSLHVQALNIGRASWLPSNASHGPVRLGSRLLDSDGHWLLESYSRNALPNDRPVLPGESISFDAIIQAPPPGRYILEFDLVAEGVAWFSRNGSVPCQVPIVVNEP